MRIDKKKLGELLKDERIDAGMTQAQLAKRVGHGMTQGWISQYEGGKQVPDIFKFFLIMMVLDANMQHVYERAVVNNTSTSKGKT